jgi:sugar phosphate isomerase/epimerase
MSFINKFFLSIFILGNLYFPSFAQDKLGVVSYTYRENFKQDVPGTLDKIKSIGITNIELSSLFGKSAGEFRELLDERGMVCTSYGVDYKKLSENIEEVIENAKVLGARYVRVAWIPHQAPFQLEDARKAVELFNVAGKMLKDQGLSFCYHNHGYEFKPFEKGTYFDYMVRNTNPEYVNFEIDILWVYHPGQDPAKLIKKYPTRFKLMHVKDLKRGVVGDYSGSTSNENNVSLGTGQIDIAAVWKAAKKSSIEFIYIEDESSEVDKQVPQSLLYLKDLEKNKQKKLR